MHVQLLLEWEKDALVSEAQAEIGSRATFDPQAKPQPGERQPAQQDWSTGSKGGRS